MSTKPPFRFQQFTLRDDRVAMKVGTDGVLLGAWAPIREAGKILDIGTGCGIIALMLAQRTAETDSCISAIEIDGECRNPMTRFICRCSVLLSRSKQHKLDSNWLFAIRPSSRHRICPKIIDAGPPDIATCYHVSHFFSKLQTC
jgi:hypothetical protein